MAKAFSSIIFGIIFVYVFGGVIGTLPGAIFIGGGICWLLWLMLVGFSNQSKGDAWIKSYPGSKYKFAYGECGIAAGENQLHLCEFGYTKSYAFNDIRSWETNLSTGGEIIGGGGNIEQAIHFGIANRKQQKNNEKNTGLFVKVRDVDKPIWRIRFSKNEEEEKSLQAKWFEILSQTLNENVKAAVEPKAAESGEPLQISAQPSRRLYRFCQSCGVKSGREALFCEGCGVKMSRIND